MQSPIVPALSLIGCASAVTALLSFATPVSESDEDRLSAGLASVSADRIQADLDFIASDELRGRDTPSPELKIAARYIRARLARMGFEPGAPDDSYFYMYELAYSPLDLERSHLDVTVGGVQQSFEPGRDYFFSSSRDGFSVDVTADVVFCGYGRRNDFPDDIAGKWALCLDNGRGRSRRGNTAQAAGALGLLTFPGAEYDEEPYVERFSVPMATLTRGQVSYPDGPKVESGFPQLFLTRERGLELLERSPARPEEVAAADWMPELGTALGMRATESRQLQFENGRIALENVCGFWPGADPELSKEVILVSAHYDHVGARGGEIYNGADDNGTGTCGLLALSEALATYGPLNRSVLLIWVSGEEKGLLGSKAWADDPWLPDGHRAVANINIDMIGRNSSDQLLYTPTSRLKEFYNGLAQVTEALAPLEGFSDLGSADAYYHRSDQAEFERLGIPVMFLFSDIHDDYHKPTDTPDKIDTDKVRRVVRLVLRMLVELEDGPLER